MKRYFFLLIVFLTLGVGRLGAQGATTSFDKTVDFSKFKTYKWVTIKDAQQLDELTSDQLIGTLETELAKKGLTKSNSDKADLYIGYQIAGPDQKHPSNVIIGGSYGSAAGASSGNGGLTRTVHPGQLVLDMYDSEKKQLVWRSVVSDAIDANAKPDKKQKRMDKAVEKLLKEYPSQKDS
jgi:Domain of unknown function (DUF4136)